MKRILILAALGLGVLAFNAGAQTTATYSSNMVTIPIICQHATTNLAAGIAYTNRVWQGRNIGIGMSFWGGNASNNGTIGFQFGVVAQGANAQKTTTRPFTITSTVNGTTPVIDWAVIPATTLGPADSLILLGITNAAVNVNVGAAASSVLVSNLWLQTDTRP
jgi:hypothetical protein